MYSVVYIDIYLSLYNEGLISDKHIVCMLIYTAKNFCKTTIISV